IETDEMIDPVAVEQRGAAARAIAQPAEVVARDHVPSVERRAPVLALGAERVGRGADRGVEVKLLLPRPDVRAVEIDHEGQVTKNRDAVALAARLAPLAVRQPLQILVIEPLVRELAARAIQIVRAAVAQAVGPFGPRPIAFAGVDGAEQAVVVDPPRLI